MSEAKMLRNARTVLTQPRVLVEYLSWTFQRTFASGGPTRRIGAIVLGGFNGFSEYHSLPADLSDGELEFLRSYPFGDGVFIDIGANLGLFALAAIHAHPGRRVVAFEPVRSTYECLRRNVAFNHADVECHQLALSDRVGIGTFVVRESARANSSLPSELVLPNEKRVEVECTTLDRFATEYGITRIALLKIDVEGFETAVLKGAQYVLSVLRPPVIYFEVCGALAHLAGFATNEAIFELQRHGYLLNRIDSRGHLMPVSPDCSTQRDVENWVATAL